MDTLLISFNLLGGLAVFLFGMKIMSDGLQKMAGIKMRQLLAVATNNRVAATFSGMLVTAVIQSSSATTVMVVGFTSAGLLTLYQALGVIFGANIGTTLTAWVVSLFGFKIQISLFALPVIALGFFGQFLPAKWVLIRRIAEAAIGFGLLFLGLDIMKNTLPADFAQHPDIVAWLSRFTPSHLGNLCLLISTGSILTVLLQSSSAVMALTLTCAAAGIINFPTACALVLGENLGTTVTANLAAIGAPKNARRAALGHFLFNLFGVLWVCLLFNPFIRAIDWLVPGNVHLTDTTTLTSVLPYHIAAFHSAFNILNTLLLLPLLKQLAAVTLFFIPKTKQEDARQDTELIYLNTHVYATPELALLAARKEIERMLAFAAKQVDKLLYALKTTDEKLFSRLLSDIKKYEQNTDVLEHKINSYLAQMAHGNLSRHAVAQTVVLFNLTNYLESITDCGEKIATLLQKYLFAQPAAFSPDDIENLQHMARQANKSVKLAAEAISYFPNLAADQKQTVTDLLAQATAQENTLNTLHQTLQQQRNERISTGGEKATPASIAAYSDLLNHFESIGDYTLHFIQSALSWKTITNGEIK